MTGIQLPPLIKEPPEEKKKNVNPISIKNLVQFRGQEAPLLPDPQPPEEENEVADMASSIVRGKKLNKELVIRLIPDKGVFNSAEKKRFVGIVNQYLADFKDEEPTASDVDDIFEIAKSDILEMRVLAATKNDPAALLTVSQFLEKNNKRKQAAKENLGSRRSDRRDPRAGQGLSIADLVASYDNNQKLKDENRIRALMEEEEEVTKRLDEELKKDGY